MFRKADSNSVRASGLLGSSSSTEDFLNFTEFRLVRFILHAANHPLASFTHAFHETPHQCTLSFLRNSSATKRLAASSGAAAIVVESLRRYSRQPLPLSRSCPSQITTPPETARRSYLPAPRPPRRKSLWLRRSRRTLARAHPRPPPGLVCPSRREPGSPERRSERLRSRGRFHEAVKARAARDKHKKHKTTSENTTWQLLFRSPSDSIAGVCVYMLTCTTHEPYIVSFTEPPS